MTLSTVQQQAVSFFGQQKFSELISFLNGQPVNFPDKQMPVIQSTPDKDRIGQFGCRCSPTHYAIREDDHWVVFTVDLDGELTLNLHGCLPQSVDWVNGSQSTQWIFKSKINQAEADLLVIENG